MSHRLLATATFVATLALAFATPSTARAERPASTGIYTEAGIGGGGFIGNASSAAKAGLAVGGRIGYDLFSWLSVGGVFSATTHEATVPPPPEDEFFQMYSVSAEGRIGFRVGWFAMYVAGGYGVGGISSNILGKVGITGTGERLSNVLHGSGGIEYQLQNRHYALGVDTTYQLWLNFEESQLVTVRAYLRYTY